MSRPLKSAGDMRLRGRHLLRVPLAVLIAIFLTAMIVSAIGNSKQPQPTDNIVGVPSDVQPVKFKIREKEVESGYRVTIGDWIVVTDRSAIRGPASLAEVLPDRFAVPSATMAALCRMAKHEGQEVVIKGFPSSHEEGGKRFFLATAISYRSEEFKLQIKE